MTRESSSEYGISRRIHQSLQKPKHETTPKTMRCYFDLINGVDTITDTDGIEVDDIGEAHAQALKAIEELLEDGGMPPDAWQGWRLEAVDASGLMLFSINLGRGITH